MWLRHALKLLSLILIVSACSPSDRQQVDKLNSLSYAYHYRNIDSTEYYAREALRLSQHYRDGQAEALNNLAFVNIIRMRYDEATLQLDSVDNLTDNQVERLIAEVQQMRLCQRRSNNREFYDHRELAQRALKRINEERGQLSERLQSRLLYAESELGIVNSTYYYYVGLERQSIESLLSVGNIVEKDTAQLLNYLYNVGTGGIITQGTQAEINQQEFDYLMRCFLMSRQGNYPFFAANSLEALAEHLAEPSYRQQLLHDNLPALKFINPENVDDDELPIWLAEGSLAIFREYGDVYQIAGAYRTLAACYRSMGDYESTLFNLEQSLGDPTILQAPDLVASIREQLSVAYAAINDKQQSDHNRNLYLDLQEQTRQDRYLEARASQLDQTVAQLNWMLLAVMFAIVLLVFSLWLFYRLHQRRKQDGHLEELLTPLSDWQKQNQLKAEDLQEHYEELEEQLALGQLHISNDERRNLEQRSKVALVNNITPFIDRIIHEAKRLNEDDGKREERMDYIRELTDKINEYNDVLTHWIQLRQGELNLHIESFPLQQLFDILAKSKMSFQMKGIGLEVEPTQVKVKADRVLTLFMLNTLADNARKFTHEGGSVTISAQESEHYVEVSVTDTGEGIDAEQLGHIFEHNISGGHGFGLLNCRGIIEKYRKMSRIFDVCLLSAESQRGRGSRFFFRLPKGVARVVGCWLLALCSVASAWAEIEHPSTILAQAHVYADSAYFCNINRQYERTLAFADSSITCLNQFYREQHALGTDTLTMLGDPSVISADVKWLHDEEPVNFNTLLDVRNETAVAALALHEWQLYTYNNKIYTQLYKELSADASLDDYCRKMQQSQSNRTIAIILLVLVLIALLPAYYLLYYRHQLYYRFCVERIKAMGDILGDDATPADKLSRIAPLAHEQYPPALQEIVTKIIDALKQSQETDEEQQQNIELVEDELRRTQLEADNLHVANAVLDNCLSTLKHETMYYPSRIHQLVDDGDVQSLAEVAAYYRELYGILSEQAMRQVEHVKLHLKPLRDDILGDETLIDYLFELLAKEQGNKKLAVTIVPKDEKYVICCVPMPNLSAQRDLFTPAIENIPYLMCRQIVREHGEATNRRGCSITTETIDNQTSILITLPRQHAYGKL